MSYIDPDLLHGVLDNVIACVNDNSAALTAKGVTPANIVTNLTAIRDDLQTKKDARDKQKTALLVCQKAFNKSATDNYDAFSDAVDSLAGLLGKKSPAGKQILGYRKHITGSDQRSSAQPAPAAATAAKSSV